MEEKRKIKVSKYLSKHLRHTPEKIGLKLDEAGWVSIDELLKACEKNHFKISYDELIEVVETNNKKRYAISEDNKMIRASQGHSIEIELGYTPTKPHEILYHGTATHNIESISKLGLQKMERHHVHLSSDVETAIKVGSRHGKPLVYKVNSGKMFNDGYSFFVSENGVWLTDFVLPEYLEILEY